MKWDNKLFSFVFLLFFLLFGFSQKGNSQIDEANGIIVAFHPSVGNAINLSEKKEFNFFSEYNDSLFESAQLVKYSNNRYTVLFKTTKGGSFEKPITTDELDEIYASVEKVKPAEKALPTNDGGEKKLTKEELEKQQKKDDHYESVQTIAEITFQIIFVLLEIWAGSN